MSLWAYIRGWVELSEETLGDVHQTIEASIGDAVRFGLTEGEAEQYNEGWVVPVEARSWVCYAFYGREVRVRSVPFVRHQMELIAQITVIGADGEEERPLGVIHVNEEAADRPPRIWELKDGHVREYPGAPAV